MRLLEHALQLRIPGRDAVVEALRHLRPQPAQPLGVAADAPVAVHLEDAAELSVGGGVEVVLDRPDRQRGAEHLVPGVGLRRARTRSRAASARATGTGAAPPARSSRRACRCRDSSRWRRCSLPTPTSARRPGGARSATSRIDRLAATASVTSGGSVVSCRHSLKRSERARRPSYSVRQCATSAARLSKRPAYQARKRPLSGSVGGAGRILAAAQVAERHVPGELDANRARGAGLERHAARTAIRPAPAGLP